MRQSSKAVLALLEQQNTLLADIARSVAENNRLLSGIVDMVRATSGGTAAGALAEEVAHSSLFEILSTHAPEWEQSHIGTRLRNLLTEIQHEAGGTTVGDFLRLLDRPPSEGSLSRHRFIARNAGAATLNPFFAALKKAGIDFGTVSAGSAGTYSFR